MEINKRPNGLIIGSIFTVVTLLLCATMIVPIMAIMPGVIVEKLASKIVSNDPYSNVELLTSAMLLIIFLLALIPALLLLRSTTPPEEPYSRLKLLLIMGTLYFIINPLVFYVHANLKSHNASDGQYVMTCFTTAPISSFFFIPIGILADAVKKPA